MLFALCLLPAALRFLPAGTITSFSYESGHGWAGGNDGWSITFTWNGQTYQKNGYDCFLSGLKRITGFFRALPCPDIPENG